MADNPVPVSGRSCPACGAPEARWCGVEIRGVYDGVLYWTCEVCRHAWNRWDRESMPERWALAQYWMALRKATR